MADLLLPVSILLVLVVLFLKKGVVVAQVTSNSMLPTYSPGERLLVMTWYPRKLLKVGQVILFAFDGVFDSNGEKVADTGPMVKRIVALGGETPTLDDVPATHTNNRSHFAESSIEYARHSFPVPERCLFVCGDNLGESIDSRSFGAIEMNRVIGLVLYKFAAS